MKIGILGGGNCHALAFARHFAQIGIDCFGIGRALGKADPLWLVPAGYRYYVAHIGEWLNKALSIIDKESPDVLVNIAAQGEGAASFGTDSWLYYQTNCVYLVRLAEALRSRSWLQRFVQISTSELYGSADRAMPEDAPIRATSPYAISKAAFDSHLEVMHRVHGFQMQIVRPSNCYTAGQQLHRVIPRAVICALYGKTLKLQGGGVARKSFLDTEDLAKALMIVIERGEIGKIYNVGPDKPTSIKDVVAEVSRVTGIGDFIDEVPGRLGEDSCYWLDSSRVKALGWKQTISLSEGIGRMVAWAKDYPKLASMTHAYSIRP